jgi:hypothetical protein
VCVLVDSCSNHDTCVRITNILQMMTLVYPKFLLDNSITSLSGFYIHLSLQLGGVSLLLFLVVGICPIYLLPTSSIAITRSLGKTKISGYL